VLRRSGSEAQCLAYDRHLLLRQHLARGGNPNEAHQLWVDSRGTIRPRVVGRLAEPPRGATWELFRPSPSEMRICRPILGSPNLLHFRFSYSEDLPDAGVPLQL
jgi:hypothetical protein